MQTLARTLAGYDLELLKVIATRWDVELKGRDVEKAADQLAKAMLQAEPVEQMWNKLDDDQRGCLQAVLGSAGSKMLGVMFSRMFGEIRQMGPGKLEREKPYLTPTSVAEVLYYRGLIAPSFGEGAKGTQAFIYVPSDLVPLMPTHKTSYVVEAQPQTIAPMPTPENIRVADTTIIDDITSLMAYCQAADVALIDGQLAPQNATEIKAFLLGSSSTARLGIMIALAADLGIATVKEAMLRPVGTKLREWLELPRPAQVKALAETWRSSASYNELAFTPGLKAERLGNDPLLARQTVLTFLETTPPNGWWEVSAFIEMVKEDEPDFQRPSGEYDSWYIRDAASNQYLRGFESWDKVDGAMLRFILTGPMHGLGLMDTAQNGAYCKLTAYGRAFTGEAEWIAPSPETTPIKIHPDGLCEVPRTANRFNRFQLSRFTQWIKAGDPYQYRIDGDGLTRAADQNISGEQILAFLRRATNDAVPPTIAQMVETWGQAGAQAATIRHLVVLQLPTPEVLEAIAKNPAIRRYLGATIGPQAVVVKAEQVNALVAALQANGITVQVES